MAGTLPKSRAAGDAHPRSTVPPMDPNRAPDWARPIVHWEIVARDPERQAAFYREMFNWDIGPGPFMFIPAGIGGPEPGPGGHMRAGEQSAVILYVQVRDLAESLERAAKLGGSVLAEPIDLPTGPTIASIADPEGNAIGLVQQ